MQGNEPFHVDEEMLSVRERAGQLARVHGVDALLPDPAPDVFAGTGELDPMLQALLGRNVPAGAGALLDLTEPQWRWVVDRLDQADAEELAVLRKRHTALTERRLRLIAY